MKNAKISLLALSVLAGGSLGVFAAPAPNTGSDLGVSVTWSNAATPIYFIDGAPIPDTNGSIVVETLNERVFSDASGKIDGAAVYRFTFVNSSNTLAIADLVCSVSGNVISKSSAPNGTQATITIRGNGSSVDSAGVIGVASINATFQGSPTNTTTPTSTSEITSFFRGTFTSGTLKTGLASVNGGKSLNLKAAAAGASGFAQQLFLDGQVVQSNSKLYAAGQTVSEVTLDGNGSVNSKKGTYTLNTSGFGFGKGSSLKLNGTTAVTTNIWFQFGTNPPILATVGIPATADATGKIGGQTVKAAGGLVQTFTP